MKNMVRFTVLAASMIFVAGCYTPGGDQVRGETAPVKKAAGSRKISVDLFVMSQCPYGITAENIVIPLAAEMESDIELKLCFVGEELEPGVPHSLHGEPEVRADLLQVCAGRHAPAQQFGLVMCMNEDPAAMPGNFDSCAEKLGMKTEMIKACADGDEGSILLLESFYEADRRNVMGSPTLFINGKEYDGPATPVGITRAFCETFTETKPEICQQLPEPVRFKMTIITDKRCEDCAKYVEAAPGQLKKIFPGLKVQVVDWATEEGRAAYKPLEGTPNRFLPAFLFDKKVQKDPAFGQLAPYMVEMGDRLLMAFEADFDPAAEICGNGIDDDGNDKVDCDDEACSSRLECKKETKKTLELFVMSQCPYGAEAVLSMKEVLPAFGKDMKFKIRYIAAEPFPGQFQSLHGPFEVTEDLRQVCAREHYAKNNRYMEYLYCRAAEYDSEDWEKCAKNGISAKVLKRCSEGEEGRKFLSEDIAYSEGLQVYGSPTWIVNSQRKFNAIAPADIQEGYCGYNKGLEGCKKKLSSESDIPAGVCGP